MSVTLTPAAFLKSQNTILTPQLVVRIEGVDTIFGALPVTERLRIGNQWQIGGLNSVGEVFKVGGVIPLENQRDIIGLEGSSTELTQQLRQSQGGSGSTTTLDIKLIDERDGFVSQLVSPGVIVDELLGSKAEVFIGFDQTAFPDDFIPVLIGTIDIIKNESGASVLTIAHPENIKRQDIFEPIEPRELAVAIDAVTTTVVLDQEAADLIPDEGYHTSYLVIGDEAMRITNVAGTTITVVRGQLDTPALPHDVGASVDSLYRLQGQGLELALQIMIGGSDEQFLTDLPIDAINQVDDGFNVPGAIKTDLLDLGLQYGITVGDFVSITGSANPANDVVKSQIIDIVDYPTGQYLVVADALVTESPAQGTMAFHSQWRTSSQGLGMDPTQVDVVEHTRLSELFSTQIPTFDFRMVDAFNGQDINTQIYFPSAAYMLPKRGRSSVGLTFPPLTDAETRTFDADTVKTPSKITGTRSVNKDLYNTVVYKYAKETLGDRYLKGQVDIFSKSVERFKKVGIKKLQIEADGLRDNVDSQVLVTRNAERIKDRYQFAAQSFAVATDFRTGFSIDIGDAVIFGDPSLKYVDINTGDRAPEKAIFEVIQKKMSLRTGDVQFTLQTTNFEISGRYGVISPASIVAEGSTTTSIRLERSFGTSDFEFEVAKWRELVGERVLIHADDWSVQETTTIQSISSSGPDTINVSPALSFVPSQGYVLEVPSYPTETDPRVMQVYKDVNVFINPELVVVSGTSQTVFDVSPADAAKAFVGTVVRVNNDDFTLYSDDAEVIDITGTTITVDTELGFVPASGMLVTLVGFSNDEGAPYRYI